MKRIAVVGGGIAGLSFCHKIYELQKRSNAPLEADLYEAGPRPGGVIASEREEGFLIESGADSFLSEKPACLELSRRLGIESEIINTQGRYRRSFVARGGKLHALPQGFYMMAPTNALAFMETPLLSLRGKIRALAEPWVRPGNDFFDESIGSFIRRRFGQEMLDRVGQPMVAGIYTGDPEILSLRSTLPRFIDLEKQHGSVIRGLMAASRDKKKHVDAAGGPRYSLFLSYKEGMEMLPNALVQKIPSQALHLNRSVKKVSFDASTRQWLLESSDGSTRFFDAVCLALPAWQAARLLSEPALGLASALSEIRYESVATVNFAYRRDQITHPLDGFGFVVPRIEKSALVACGFSSQKYAGRAPEGHTLLRAFAGGVFGKETYLMDDTELIRETRRELEKFLGIRGEPLFARLKRYPSSMVQYRLGHQALLARISREVGSFPGLILAGAAFRGVGIPDCIADAEEKADTIFNQLINNKEVAA